MTSNCILFLSVIVLGDIGAYPSVVRDDQSYADTTRDTRQANEEYNTWISEEMARISEDKTSVFIAIEAGGRGSGAGRQSNVWSFLVCIDAEFCNENLIAIFATRISWFDISP